MLRFKHYTVAVHDLDEAVTNHQSRFGMQAIGERGHNGIGNFEFQAMGYDGQTTLLLIKPSADDTPIARLMTERVNAFNPHGEGIYLLGYECDDVDAFCKQVEAGGGRVTRAPGSTNAWVHPTSSNFVLMELFPPR
ncbi:MAG: VOC family protein [Chloroflexi bacterium]|nr:VOC family protein [Chloroflexota bacterium]